MPTVWSAEQEDGKAWVLAVVEPQDELAPGQVASVPFGMRQIDLLFKLLFFLILT